MFLETASRRNPELVRLAIDLHRSGQIGPNTYVIDVDAVAANAEHLAREAARVGLSLYFMSKQINRNPVLVQQIAAFIPQAVAVDWDEALAVAAAGVSVGHLGHLVQPPESALDRLVDLSPEVVTVFSVAKALAIGAAAARRGRLQPILLRVAGEGDAFYPGQYGGFSMAELPGAMRRLLSAPGLKVQGVTSFPCLLYDQEQREAVPTSNMQALIQAGELLRREFGMRSLQINAPSMTCCATLPLLAELGATHAEPGHALTGTTPIHADQDGPELPATVYVSEISHLYGGRAYCFGGGLYPRSRVQHALVGRDPAAMLRVPVEPLPGDAIDYYGTLHPAPDQPVAVGDTVVSAFRMQMFTSRSYLALVSGGRLVGLFDSANRRVTDFATEMGVRP